MMGAMARARVQRNAAVGVVNHGSRAVLVTLAPDGEFLDRRSVELVKRASPRIRTIMRGSGPWAVT
jgi:hypothetical protein